MRGPMASTPLASPSLASPPSAPVDISCPSPTSVDLPNGIPWVGGVSLSASPSSAACGKLISDRAAEMPSTSQSPAAAAAAADTPCGCQSTAPPPSSPRYAGGLTLGSGGSWNPCCSCHFSALPDALIAAEIFACLTRTELVAVVPAVCTRWAFVAESPVLHRRIAADTPTTGRGLLRLISDGRGAHVGALRVRRLRVDSPADAAALGSAAVLPLPRLIDLDLSGSKHADGDALAAFVVCHAGRLRRLVLDGVTCLTDEHVCRIIGAAGGGLRHLSLARCPHLTDAVLGRLGDGACSPRLLSLNVGGCVGMSGDGVALFLMRAGAAADALAAQQQGVGVGEGALPILAVGPPGSTVSRRRLSARGGNGPRSSTHDASLPPRPKSTALMWRQLRPMVVLVLPPHLCTVLLIAHPRRWIRLWQRRAASCAGCWCGGCVD